MQHPALKDFSTTWESVKIVGSKALKWGAVAAIAAGALAVPVAGVAGLGGGLLGLLGFEATAAGASMATIAPALYTGGAVGGMLGAVKGLAGLSKGLDEKKQDAIADSEQADVANERAQLLAKSRSKNLEKMAGPNGFSDRKTSHVSELQQQQQHQHGVGQQI